LSIWFKATIGFIRLLELALNPFSPSKDLLRPIRKGILLKIKAGITNEEKK
jgi:hypothetical protein